MSDVKAAAERLRCSFQSVGRKNGILTQLGPTFVIPFPGETRRRIAVFQCDCGTICVVNAGNVASNRVASCGCLLRASKTIHGASDTLTYNSWKSMIARCHHESHPRYSDYGGRGIAVCQQWRESFERFLADMGERPSAEHSLDRYPDGNGSYEPGNVRWATRRQQRLNATNARRLTIDGVTMTALEWSQQPGAVNYEAILGRLYRGWSDDRAVFSPLQRQGKVTA